MAKERLYVGVDIGGTKILAVAAGEAGQILDRHRVRTPRDVDAEAILDTVAEAIDALLDEVGCDHSDLWAIGVAAPGVVRTSRGVVIVTPNMNLSGAAVVKDLKERFGAPVALGNDCNAGILGEAWLGAARGASSAVGIFVGTGIGGGLVQRGKIWRGYRDSALEVGHTIMAVDGPECGCGNHGCFESLASRTAIERDIRQAVAEGRQTMLTDLLEGDLSVIRSGALQQALADGDDLVHEVVDQAARVLGLGCLNIRHLIDPEVIVLGGGVIEACSEFLLPIIQEVQDSDPLPGSRSGGEIRLAALGDDAVALGAVALARRKIRRNPFSKQFNVLPDYPTVELKEGRLAIGRRSYDGGVCILAGGRVKKRKALAEMTKPITVKQVTRACVGGPEVVFVGADTNQGDVLAADAEQYLRQRAIEVQVLPPLQAVEAYNACKRRKAALLSLAGQADSSS
ncbi:MAG: ROK family protein [Planctomycetota bacterium]|jgi:glucokinase